MTTTTTPASSVVKVELLLSVMSASLRHQSIIYHLLMMTGWHLWISFSRNHLLSSLLNRYVNESWVVDQPEATRPATMVHLIWRTWNKASACLQSVSLLVTDCPCFISQLMNQYMELTVVILFLKAWQWNYALHEIYGSPGQRQNRPLKRQR